MGKTQAASVVKNAASLEKNLKTFKTTFKAKILNIERENHQILKPINGILYS